MVLLLDRGLVAVMTQADIDVRQLAIGQLVELRIYRQAYGLLHRRDRLRSLGHLPVATHRCLERAGAGFETPRGRLTLSGRETVENEMCRFEETIIAAERSAQAMTRTWLTGSAGAHH